MQKSRLDIAISRFLENFLKFQKIYGVIMVSWIVFPKNFRTTNRIKNQLQPPLAGANRKNHNNKNSIIKTEINKRILKKRENKFHIDQN